MRVSVVSPSTEAGGFALSGLSSNCNRLRADYLSTRRELLAGLGSRVPTVAEFDLSGHVGAGVFACRVDGAVDSLELFTAALNDSASRSSRRCDRRTGVSAILRRLRRMPRNCIE